MRGPLKPGGKHSPWALSMAGTDKKKGEGGRRGRRELEFHRQESPYKQGVI